MEDFGAEHAHFAGPREEVLEDLVAGRTYREEAGWRLFREIRDDGTTGDMQVLLTLGPPETGFWTLLGSAEFRRLAERVLRQL